MESLIAVVPTIGLMAVFIYILRNIFRADSNERMQLRKLEQEYEDSQT